MIEEPDAVKQVERDGSVSMKWQKNKRAANKQALQAKIHEVADVHVQGLSTRLFIGSTIMTNANFRRHIMQN